MKKLFSNHDWIITGLIFLLSTIGIITIYSTTFRSTSPDSGISLFYKQTSFIIIGFILYGIISNIKFQFIFSWKIIIPAYLITLALMFYVRYFSPEIAGTHRWMQIGPFSIQPSELVKLMVLIISSKILIYKDEKQGISELRTVYDSTAIWKTQAIFISKIFLSLLLILPYLYLTLTQPALGSTIIEIFLWGIMIIFLYPNKIKLFGNISIIIINIIIYSLINHFHMNLSSGITVLVGISSIFLIKKLTNIHWIEIIIATIIGLMIIPGLIYTWDNIIRDYQKTRIETFFQPEKDSQGAGWQIKQSKIAIGSGRIFGKGLLEGTQSSFGILPFAYTDFIFAAIAEQFGFIGSIIVIILLFLLPYKIYLLSIDHTNQYSKSLLFGTGSMIFVHICLHIGMNLGILPVTGTPLPFISYGGSSVIINLLALSLCQSSLQTIPDDIIIKNKFY